MTKLILSFAILILSLTAANAQALPGRITSLLSQQYAVWKQLPGSCDQRKWFLTGDFDGDGLKEYLVRIKTGKSPKSIRLKLIAFFRSGDGKYLAREILDEPYTGDLLRSSFAVVKKGTKIQLGEGEGPTITLDNDAASQYICQTDAIKTMAFKNGAWKNIYDQ